MFTILALTVTADAVIYAAGKFHECLCKPSRRARLNLS